MRISSEIKLSFPPLVHTRVDMFQNKITKQGKQTFYLYVTWTPGPLKSWLNLAQNPRLVVCEGRMSHSALCLHHSLSLQTISDQPCEIQETKSVYASLPTH